MRHRPAGKDPPPADTLLQWARRPVRQTNIRIAGVEAWLLAWIVFASRLSGDLVGVLHKTGLTLAVLHLILHALSLIADQAHDAAAVVVTDQLASPDPT